MKTLTTKEVEEHFADFLNSSKAEPVVITDQGEPVSVTFSIEDVQALVAQDGEIPAGAIQGIKSGLADAEAGKTTEVTSDSKNDFINDLIGQLKHRQLA